MGKTIRFDRWDDEEFDRKATKKDRKADRKRKREEKESFMTSGFVVNNDEE